MSASSILVAGSTTRHPTVELREAAPVTFTCRQFPSFISASQSFNTVSTASSPRPANLERQLEDLLCSRSFGPQFPCVYKYLVVSSGRKDR